MLDLAARLSLADVDELIGQHKGKAREGAPLSDAEIALNLFAEDARSMSLFNSDRALARSLGQEEEEVYVHARLILFYAVDIGFLQFWRPIADTSNPGSGPTPAADSATCCSVCRVCSEIGVVTHS